MKQKSARAKAGLVQLRREPNTTMTTKEKAELRRLEQMPESAIDTSDVPEWSDEMFRRAVHAPFHRPIKKAVSLRLDADVLVWLKRGGQGYQTRANRILRESMLKDLAG